MDERARKNAIALGLPPDAWELLEIAGKSDFPKLVSALVRVGLAENRERIMEEARNVERSL